MISYLPYISYNGYKMIYHYNKLLIEGISYLSMAIIINYLSELLIDDFPWLNVTPIPWSSFRGTGLHQHAGIQQGSTRLRNPLVSTGVRLHVTEPNQWLEWENPSKMVVRMGKSLKNDG